MKFLSLYFTLILLAVNVFAQNIVITEIMYHPPTDGIDTLEFIEMVSLELDTVTIGATEMFQLQWGLGFLLPSSVIFPPNEPIVFTNDSLAMQSLYGVAAFEWGSDTLQNAMDSIRLHFTSSWPPWDLTTYTIDQVYYDTAAPWPTEANGGGYSLHLCDIEADNWGSEHWIASPTSSGVFINGIEVFASPGVYDACTTVGIRPADQALISVYPNPASEKLNVQIENELDPSASVQIFDIMGGLVLTQPFCTSIAIDGLRPGVYLMLITDKQNSVSVRFSVLN